MAMESFNPERRDHPSLSTHYVAIVFGNPGDHNLLESLGYADLRLMSESAWGMDATITTNVIDNEPVAEFRFRLPRKPGAIDIDIL